LKLIIAAGPFTPNDSLQYEPLKDLLKIITKDKPDVCILVGPFIESNHKMIESGECGELADTFEDLFRKLIELVGETVDKLNTQVLIVPSFKDVHGHLVYPTPAFSLNRSIIVPKRLKPIT
jgi:DNA polymerase alpha subunit B